MVQILANIPDIGIKWLDQLAAKQDESRVAVLSIINIGLWQYLDMSK